MKTLQPLKLVIIKTLLLGTLPVGAANWYVLPGANPTGGDGSLGNPFCSVARALNTVAEDGDTVFIRGGTLQESTFLNGWSSNGNSVTVRNQPGEAVTWQPNGSPTILDVQGSDGLVFQNITFQNGSVNLFSNTSAVTFQSCVFTGTPTNNNILLLQDVTNIGLNQCTFLGVRSKDTVFVKGGLLNVSFTDNTFTNCYPNTVTDHKTLGFVDVTSAVNVQITGNTFEHTNSKNSRPTLQKINTNLANSQNAVAIGITRMIGQANPQPGFQDGVAQYGVVIQNNTITGYRYRATRDGRNLDPTHIITPEQGGEIGDAITLNQSEYIQITQNQISDISYTGLLINDSAWIEVSENTFDQVGGCGIFVTGDPNGATEPHPVLIADNHVRNSGWMLGGTSGISTINTETGHVIVRNWVDGHVNGTPGTQGTVWFGDGNGIIADLFSQGNVIVGNVSTGNEGSGITINAADDCVVLFNTMIRNGESATNTAQGGLFIAGEVGPSRRTLVSDNLMYNNKRCQFWTFGSTPNTTLNNNIFSSGTFTRAVGVLNPIEWNLTRYSITDWFQNPPSGKTGSGDSFAQQAILGDLIDKDLGASPLCSIPVNGGTKNVTSSPISTFQNLTEVAKALSRFPNADILSMSMDVDHGRATRNATSPNTGALEAPDLIEGFIDQGTIRLENTVPNEGNLILDFLGSRIDNSGGCDIFGNLTFIENSRNVATSRMGWLWIPPDQPLGNEWVFSNRFGWVAPRQLTTGVPRFYNAEQGAFFDVRPNGNFYHFGYRQTMRPLSTPKTYDAGPLGRVTFGDFDKWASSSRFGWIWPVGDGVWFWSEARKEWLGITGGGGIWSSAQNRFL